MIFQKVRAPEIIGRRAAVQYKKKGRERSGTNIVVTILRKPMAVGGAAAWRSRRSVEQNMLVPVGHEVSRNPALASCLAGHRPRGPKLVWSVPAWSRSPRRANR